MDEEITTHGHASCASYMMMLEVMDPDNMKDWERRMMGEIAELKSIQTDIKAL